MEQSDEQINVIWNYVKYLCNKWLNSNSFKHKINLRIWIYYLDKPKFSLKYGNTME